MIEGSLLLNFKVGMADENNNPPDFYLQFAVRLGYIQPGSESALILNRGFNRGGKSNIRIMNKV